MLNHSYCHPEVCFALVSLVANIHTHTQHDALLTAAMFTCSKVCLAWPEPELFFACQTVCRWCTYFWNFLHNSDTKHFGAACQKKLQQMLRRMAPPCYSDRGKYYCKTRAVLNIEEVEKGRNLWSSLGAGIFYWNFYSRLSDFIVNLKLLLSGINKKKKKRRFSMDPAESQYKYPLCNFLICAWVWWVQILIS